MNSPSNLDPKTSPIHQTFSSSSQKKTLLDVVVGTRVFDILDHDASSVGAITKHHATFLPVFFCPRKHDASRLQPPHRWGIYPFGGYPSLPRVSWSAPAHATFYNCRSQCLSPFPSALPDPKKRTTRTYDYPFLWLRNPSFLRYITSFEPRVQERCDTRGT